MAHKRHRRESGFAVILTTLSLFATVLIAGLGLDCSIIFLIQTKLQGALDAGAMAAVRTLTQNPSITNAQLVGTEFLTANFPAGFMGAKQVVATDYGTISVTPVKYDGLTPGTAGTSAVAKLVDAKAHVLAPLYFLSVTGSNWVPVGAIAQAKREGMLIMLVMDGSYSMWTHSFTANSQTKNACQWAGYYAHQFLGYGQFDPDIDRIGMVAFGGQTYTVAPTSNFQTWNGSAYVLNTTTNAVYTALTDYYTANNANDTDDSSARSDDPGCGGNTNTMEGLQAAYVAMQNFYILEKTNGYASCNTCRNRADIVVMMTDGAPNGMTNDWYPYRNDSCAPVPATPARLVGYVAKHGETGENGILSTALNTPTNDNAAMGTPNVIPTVNCQITGGTRNNDNMYNFWQDFTQVPPTNYYGDSITGASLIYPAASVNILAGESGYITNYDGFYYLYCNAAEATASRLRSDLNFRVTIFTIGVFGNSLGNKYDAPNCYLMYRLSNSPQDATLPNACTNDLPPTPFPATYTVNKDQPQGDFVIAADASVLNVAFATVAREISARLSK